MPTWIRNERGRSRATLGMLASSIDMDAPLAFCCLRHSLNEKEKHRVYEVRSEATPDDVPVDEIRRESLWPATLLTAGDSWKTRLNCVVTLMNSDDQSSNRRTTDACSRSRLVCDSTWRSSVELEKKENTKKRKNPTRVALIMLDDDLEMLCANTRESRRRRKRRRRRKKKEKEKRLLSQ